MVARRKKPARKTEWKAWNADFAKGFGGAVDWTPPAHVKVVTGRSSGSMTAVFTDPDGKPVEGFIKFRAQGGEWKIVDNGFRIVVRMTLKGGAK